MAIVLITGSIMVIWSLTPLVVVASAVPFTLTVNVFPRVLPFWLATTFRISELNSITTYSASASLSLFVIFPRLNIGLSPSGNGFPVAPPSLFVIAAAGKANVGDTTVVPEITGLEPIAAVDDVAQFAPPLQMKATLVEPSFRYAMLVTILSRSWRLVVTPWGRSITRRYRTISPMATFEPAVESSEVATTVFAAPITPRFAVDVLPVPPLVEVVVTLFVFVPAVVPVTVTVTVQLLFTGIVAPLKLTLPPFAAAVTVPPEQVVDAFGVAAFCKPAGYVSVKATPVKATVFAAGLVIVNVMIDVPLTETALVPNTLAITGGATTVRFALAVVPVKATGPVAVDAFVVFVIAPAVVLVTFMTI